MSELVLVNTFQNREEVLELEGVVDSHGVGPKNFSSLIGDYHFTNDVRPLKCCCIKQGGRLCGQDHRNGYVVELIDGNKSLLGSTCVKEFDVEGELRKSINHYENAKIYEERITYVNNMFYERKRVLPDLREKKLKLEEVSNYYSSIVDSLPSSAMRKLHDMAKQGKGDVAVELVYIEEKINEETGRVERDKDVIPHTVGRLSGLKVFHKESWASLAEDINEKIEFLESLEYTNRGESSRKVVLLYKKVEEISRLFSLSDSFISEKFLFEHSDKKSLCFLVPNVEERVKLVRMWLLESQSKPIGPIAAREKLREMDEEIKQHYGAQELRIP